MLCNLNDKGVEGVLKENREIADKLNEFSAPILTAEDIKLFRLLKQKKGEGKKKEIAKGKEQSE